MKSPILALALLTLSTTTMAQTRDSCTLGKPELKADCELLSNGAGQPVQMTDMDAWLKAYEAVLAAHPATPEDKGANVEMLRRGEIMLQRLQMIEYRKPVVDKLESLVDAFAKRIGARRIGQPS
jgi:hypothetical protein